MPKRTEKPIRLDQAVTRLLVRLGGLAALAILAALVVNLWRTHQYAQTDRYIAASEALAVSHAGMLDEETGLRGYLDTRQRSLLQPYTAGQQELKQGDATLQTYVGGDPGLVDDFVTLRLAQGNWNTQWATPALTAPPSGDLGGFLDSGKLLFDAYRVTETRVDSALLGRISEAEASAAAVATAGLAVELVLLFGAAFLWWRARRGLRRAVVGPVSTILAGLERVEAGDYSPVEPMATGSAELRAISRRLAGVVGHLEKARAGVRQREQESVDHAARLRLIVDMGHEIAGSLNLHYVLQAVCDSVIGIGAFARCVIWLTDDGNATLVPAHDSGGIKGRVAGLEPIVVGEDVVGKAARYGRFVGPDDVSHPEVVNPWTRAVAVPMIVGARVVGVLEIGMDDRADLALPMLELISTVSSQAATAIEAARLYEQADTRGKTDALTLLPNRRDLDRSLGTEVSRAQRYGRPLSVAMIDIDHFKVVNDTQGHAHGDEILQETAAVMRAVLRDVDLIYRYGGEEFLVVMPETGAAAAHELCERLRRSVSERVQVRGGKQLTVSCGVAAYPLNGADPARLIAAADAALYSAKRGGRDRVVAAGADITIAQPRSA